MADVSDFLVEIGTEELPPRALPLLSDSFAEGIRDGLAGVGLTHGDLNQFATPRRLAVRVRDLAQRQPDRDIERLGPPVDIAFDKSGRPAKPALAFAETCAVELAAIETVSTPKGDRLVYRATQAGVTARELMPEIVAIALDRLPIPKRMRWGAGDAEFVRPVHWVVMLLGRKTVECELFGICAGNATRGHRFHAPGSIALKSAGEYDRLLEKKGYVIADFSRRRERISAAATKAASAIGAIPLLEHEVLNEVTALVEWPVAHAGSFDERFLDLPREVLIASLQHHQRYFPVTDEHGGLKPSFVAISNIESRDPAEVTAGNERVVRPRLADAAFFFDTDKSVSLEARRDDLKGVVFQKELGSLYDKSERITRLAGAIAKMLSADVALAKRTAALLKCDLLTEMVGEFPELQGTMGRYYANHDNENEEVATAIEEHYLPRHAGDRLPATPTGMTLAIADKLDTITAIFSIGERPSGARDPFGLRRKALGVLRIAVEGKVDLDLDAAIDAAIGTLDDADDAGSLKTEVYDYIMERLRAYYLDRRDELSVTTEMFEAVLARRPSQPLDFDRRLHAVSEFMRLDAASSLAAANKRIANILRQAGVEITGKPDARKFKQAEESTLYNQVLELEKQIRPLLNERRYTEVLTTLAALKDAVDSFFDHVLVMTDDPSLQKNRLALLKELRMLFLEIADVSRLPAPA